MEASRSTKSRSSWRSSKSSESGQSFTSYFRRKKRREAELKEEARKRAEEKLRELLQPAPFSEEEEKRILELKHLKRWKRTQQPPGRHREFRAATLPRIPEAHVPTTLNDLDTDILGRHELPVYDNGQEPFFQRSMKALHQHTWEQRVAVVATLTVLLFLSLHADIVGPIFLPKQLFLDNRLAPWYIIVLKDWGTFCHMSACSLIHFALCDVSLIYAFETLEVGSKTGPKVKEFYREKVHFAVAALSGSIVALSICKALLAAWFRMLRELLETAISLAYDLVQQIGNVHHNLMAGLSKIGQVILKPSEWISSVLSGLARLCTAVCIWILAVLIPFDGAERPLAARMVGRSHSDLAAEVVQERAFDEWGLVNSTTTLNNTLNATMNETIGEIVTSQALEIREVIYWRNDAFSTSRALLSRSAVFLVSLLVAIHYYMKGYRHKPSTSLISARGPHTATHVDDHSSIQTTPSLARDETEIHANLSSDTSMETYSTIAANRPSSITITIAPNS